MRLHRAPQPLGGPKQQVHPHLLLYVGELKVASSSIYLHVLHAFIVHLFAKHVSGNQVKMHGDFDLITHEEAALKSPLGWAVTWQVTSADRFDGMIDSDVK